VAIRALLPCVAHGQSAKEINEQYPLPRRPERRLPALRGQRLDQTLGRSWSFDLGYMLVYQQKASGYSTTSTTRFFCFTPDLRKEKSSHHPESGEEQTAR
jgi:hypothetical protein